MANTTTTPNMSLPVPVPGVDPGPDWATNIVTDMYTLDAHDHSSGKGVQINPAGLNINSDLPVNDNNITLTRSVRFFAQGSPISGSADLDCIYVSGVDLYYNDGSGNQVRITQGGSVTGSAGTITGLPSGTASAAYSASTFTFQSATSTPANLNVGPITIGTNTASPKTVTITPSGSQVANYSMTLPVALPGALSVVTLDNSGNLGSSAITGSGSAVFSANPTLTGANLTAGSVFNGGTITGSLSGSPVFSNGIQISSANGININTGGGLTITSGGSGISNVGGGNAPSQAFKTAVFTHTFTGSSQTATFDISGSGSQIIGAFGYANGSSFTALGSTSGYSFTGGTVATNFTVTSSVGGTAVIFVVVFYQ